MLFPDLKIMQVEELGELLVVMTQKELYLVDLKKILTQLIVTEKDNSNFGIKISPNRQYLCLHRAKESVVYQIDSSKLQYFKTVD